MRFHTLAAALVAAGCGARAYCYHLNPSLNHDDAALALNIIRRSARELRDRLDYSQLAPWGFLVAERAGVAIAGTSEPALRFVPFIAALISVPAFWYLASRRLGHVEAIFATGFFSVSQDLIISAIQVKQYSLETLTAILMLIAAGPLLDGSMTSRRWALTAAAGTAAIWFSFTAVFVLAGIGLAALIGRGHSRDSRQVLVVGIAWIVSALLYASALLRHQMRDSAMFDIWRHEFPPSIASQWPAWLMDRFVTLGSVSTSVRLGPIFAGGIIVALGLAFTSGRRFRIALALTILTTLAAGAAGLYPFVGRFLFFAAPAALLLVFGEIGAWARAQSPAVARTLAVTASIALLYAAASLANRLLVTGIDFDDPRGVYTHIRQRIDDVDLIHGSPAAQPSMRYYAPDLAIRQLAPTAWPSDARVWFVFFWPTESDFDRRVVESARRHGEQYETVTCALHRATRWQLSPNQVARPSNR